MQKLKLSPSKLSGTVHIPPSKSFAHRALICSALSVLSGSTDSAVINNYSDSRDMQATENFIRRLGLLPCVSEDGKSVTVRKSTEMPAAGSVDCIESGSTLRFVIPIAAALGLSCTFVGSGRLPERPLEVYEKLLPEHGITMTRESSERFLPLAITGKLQSGDFELPGNISSQFISGLMFALPLLEGDSRIIITTELESKSYIDITISVLRKFGISIEETDCGYFVKGGQKYSCTDYTVEGDWSQAAFFFTMAALGSSPIVIEGLDEHSVQGDRKICEIYSKMGLNIKFDGSSCIVFNPSSSEKFHGLKPVSFDASDIPDAVPAISTALSQADGTSIISGAARLRIKECDRLTAVREAIEKLGGEIVEKPDGLVIKGVRELHSADVNGFNDHRMLMSVSSVMQAVNGDVTVSDPLSIRKSYPHFYEDFRSLGGIADVINMG